MHSHRTNTPSLLCGTVLCSDLETYCASAQVNSDAVKSGAQGDGVPPSEAREFCDWLAGASAPKVAGLNFSVCALGDT